MAAYGEYRTLLPDLRREGEEADRLRSAGFADGLWRCCGEGVLWLPGSSRRVGRVAFEAEDSPKVFISSRKDGRMVDIVVGDVPRDIACQRRRERPGWRGQLEPRGTAG